jgi:alkylation response protein AidB-like acyl-CoA dehydrogenase
MNFDFPEDLKAMREEVRRVLRERCPPAVMRKALDGGAGMDRALWKEMADLGWVGASIPEEHGGSGLGHLATCMLAEEIGAALAPVPFSSSVYMGAEALLMAGSAAQKARWLPKLATGEVIATFAAAERIGPLLLDKLRTRLVDGKLSGTKVAVPDADVAHLCIVAAVDARRGPALTLVELDGPGVTREVVATIDPSRSHATLTFADAPAELLENGAGAGAVRRLMERAAVMMAFEQVGGAQAALDMAVAYAKERYAFGRPIGSFQAIKHKLADVYVAVEIARSNAYWGAWALSTDAPELPLAAATARIAANDAGWLASKENVQTHGGMGFTWEGDAQLYYRRARLLGLALGGSSEWKRRLAGELKTRNAASLAPME